LHEQRAFKKEDKSKVMQVPLAQ